MPLLKGIGRREHLVVKAEGTHFLVNITIGRMYSHMNESMDNVCIH